MGKLKPFLPEADLTPEDLAEVHPDLAPRRPTGTSSTARTRPTGGDYSTPRAGTPPTPSKARTAPAGTAQAAGTPSATAAVPGRQQETRSGKRKVQTQAPRKARAEQAARDPGATRAAQATQATQTTKRAQRGHPGTVPRSTPAAAAPSRPPKRRKAAPKRPRQPQARPDDRAARTVRLEPVAEVKLQRIVADFGVTTNAAMSIAITHGYRALLDAGLVQPVKPGAAA